MQDYKLVTECLGYQSAPDKTNTDPRFLVGGSQNVFINRQKKVESRKGYTRLGVSNTALTPIRSAMTWFNSIGGELPMRMYDDELEVYLGTVDTLAINGWRRVLDGISTTEIVRYATWWDATENLDLLLFIQGNANIYEWNGAVAVVASASGTSITKRGTSTWAQNRFYTTRNKTLINLTTGNEHTYTGGETTTTLTGLNNITGISSGDILVQKVVTSTNEPAASHNNHTIYSFENQLIIGSKDDNEIWIMQNDSYTDSTFSAPRIAGEGGLLTLDGPSRGIGSVNKILVLFSGKHSMFRAEYQEITVSSTLAEILRVKKIQTSENQGAFNADCILTAGRDLVYLSNEPALRTIQDPEQLESFNPRTLSNPVKPDFDAEDFTNATMIWARNAVHLSAPVNSKVYILEFVEDADGKLKRYWQAPQILPVRAFSIIDGDLHGHSNGVPETYKLFDGFADTASDDSKLPIQCIAKFAYWSGGKRAELKNFDEYYVEGEISPQTNDLILTLSYDFGGFTQQIERTIDGTNKDILEETLLSASLGQQPLAQSPTGGALDEPADTAKFRVIFEMAKEDFNEIQASFETNEIDRFWSILAHGPNATLSTRRDTVRRL